MEPSLFSIDLVVAARRSDELRDLPADTISRDVRDYERFLLLVKRHPSDPIAPTRAIDRIWHLHMLHPRAYHDDCHHLFGDLLDHDGGFGSEASEEPILRDTFARTAQWWHEAYGESYTGTAGGTIVKCTRNCVSRCQRKCQSMQVKGRAS